MPQEFYVQPKKKPVDITPFKERLLQYEGFKAEPYKDSKGLWTIGIGTKIGSGSDEDYRKSPYYKKSITEEKAKEIMDTSLIEKVKKAHRDAYIGEKFFDLSSGLQTEIVSSIYRGDLSGSPKTLDLIRKGEYDKAADEFLNSKEYRAALAKHPVGGKDRGIAQRMENLAEALRQEVFIEQQKKAEQAQQQEYQPFEHRVERRIQQLP